MSLKPVSLYANKMLTQVRDQCVFVYTRARGPYKCLQISEGWVSGGWGQALFSGAQ